MVSPEGPMLTASIDMRKTFKRFRDASVTDGQAEVMTDVLVEIGETSQDNVATKGDVALLGTEIQTVRTELKTEFDRLYLNIEVALAEAHAANEQRFSRIEKEMFLLRWMFGVIMAGIATIVIRSLVP